MEKAELMKLGPIRQILQNCTIEVGIVSNLKNSNTSEVTNKIENCWVFINIWKTFDVLKFQPWLALRLRV